MTGNSWKLQDAKARFSEVVQRARQGDPQQVTVHGKEAVVIVDPKRFDVRPKPAEGLTLASFVERSKKYRAKDAIEEIAFERPFAGHFAPRPKLFDDDAP